MNTFDMAYKKRPFLFGKLPTEELLYVIRKFNINGSALELGCGDGRDTKHVLDQGMTIDAVDQSSVAIETLLTRDDIFNNQRRKLNAFASEVMSFQFSDKKYHFIYAVTLFDHLNPNDGIILLKKCFNSLCDNGYLFLKVHTEDDDGNKISNHVISEFANEIQHYYKKNELIELTKDQGRILYYIEAFEDDYDHGDPHTHVYASILIRKENLI